jgi:hypothetical protein
MNYLHDPDGVVVVVRLQPLGSGGRCVEVAAHRQQSLSGGATAMMVRVQAVCERPATAGGGRTRGGDARTDRLPQERRQSVADARHLAHAQLNRQSHH